MTNRPVRTRIAPSPTGDPHVGTAYIALFNYVFAKQHGGQFLLRIEDTDQARARRDSEKAIMDSLHWLGLSWDEGPDVGGPCGPYRQSERRDIYEKHALELLEKGEAYRCFCTNERLNQLRVYQKAANTPPGYDRLCRNLDREESDRRAAAGEPFVIRLKMPLEGDSVMVDQLRGQIVRSYRELDDQVLLKSDSFPTYHLANVVDDHLMGITHVIRAEEWIPSTPKHIRLYEAFGWEAPQWIHMPLLRNPDKTRSKISKRKNPVSLLFYKEYGVLPEALVNFLALMGFSFGNDVEKFTLPEMIQAFSFEKVSLGGPVFDLEKLVWLNGLYLREMTPQSLLDAVQGLWLNRDYFEKIMPLVHERMRTLTDFVDLSTFFFNCQLDYATEDGKQLVPKGRTPAEMVALFEELVEAIDGMEDYTVENLEALLRRVTESRGWKTKDVFMPVRVGVTGRKATPPLFESMFIVGRERTRVRLRQAMNHLKTLPAPPAAG
ncbi:glutamate--tRNA ligase [Myxococcota bacterium]|nr:glutamate--tRNA ligase [Myxococcota bacterium]